MPLVYGSPNSSGALRQGELVGPIWEHRPLLNAGGPPIDDAPIQSIVHPLVFILSPDCDLEQDYSVRFGPDRPNNPQQILSRDYEVSTLLLQVLVCPAYQEAEIRTFLPPGSDILKRVKQNENERYHTINSTHATIPVLYLDFKKAFGVPMEALYASLFGETIRLATIPPPYLQDLSHRFYSFHSRVGPPD